MYKDLPQTLQQKVKAYLLANDFRKAKEIHDSWMSNKKIPTWALTTPTHSSKI